MLNYFVFLMLVLVPFVLGIVIGFELGGADHELRTRGKLIKILRSQKRRKW